MLRPFLLMVLAVCCGASPSLAANKKRVAPAKKVSTKAPIPSRAINSEGSPDASAAPAVRGPARIDFDDRLIQGQTNKSGAVYLYERKALKIPSMIQKPEDFRDEIIGTLDNS